MSTCYICFDEYKRPLSLPCGHIFCSECLVRTVQAIKPPRNFHACPMCRGTFSIAPINPSAIPVHLRPFVTPCIRRVYLDSPCPEPSSSTSPQSSSSASSSSSSVHDSSEELARLKAENRTLRTHCVLWRRRAELHGAATLGLLDFARMVRDQAVSLAQERDELQRQCRSLKRRLEEDVDCPKGNRPYASPVEPPSHHPFTFSCPLPPTIPNGANHITDSPRLAVAALLELQSSMNQTGSSSFRSQSSQHFPTFPQPQGSRTAGLGFPSLSSQASTSTPVGPVPESSRLEPPTKRLRQSSQPALSRSTSLASSSGSGFPSVQIPSMGVPAASTTFLSM